ncbi:hypothetical protein [Agarivorans sp.]|uniref:hypothetical protein n=1 Tax=Agarivorans sp. TaxID=1872412 RepID=UPI003D094C5C
MKKLIIASICFGLAACASTPTVEEAVAAYHTELNAPYKETLREQITEECAQINYRDNAVKAHCYMADDVIVYEYRLLKFSMEWNAQAAAKITKRLLKQYCEDLSDEPLKYGFGLLVDLKGRNGFVGKVNTYQDCLAL